MRREGAGGEAAGAAVAVVDVGRPAPGDIGTSLSNSNFFGGAIWSTDREIETVFFSRSAKSIVKKQSGRSDFCFIE